jgi:hypothetical protein
MRLSVANLSFCGAGLRLLQTMTEVLACSCSSYAAPVNLSIERQQALEGDYSRTYECNSFRHMQQLDARKSRRVYS